MRANAQKIKAAIITDVTVGNRVLFPLD